MGTPEENFEKGVEYRLAGNEAFKKQDYKQGSFIKIVFDYSYSH